MITYETGKLMTFKEHYETFADIAFEAVERSREDTLLSLRVFDVRGMDCVVVRDEGEIIGYTIYGDTEKFFKWSTQMSLLIRLRKDGIKAIFMPSHVHFRKPYWGKGIYLETQRVYTADMIQQGMTHMLLWTYATKQGADYSLSRPGGIILEGLTGPQGHPVGVRDLEVFMKATEQAV